MKAVASRRHSSNRGFTLIEMLAVVAIIALVIGIALPNLGVRSRRVMANEAQQLAASLEFARQRSVMTGVSHRVVIDVEEGSYWLEWLVSEAEASGEEALQETPVYELGEWQAVPMAPPVTAARQYRPLPGELGHATLLREIIHIEAVETAGGFLERGAVNITFERDGTSESAAILLADEDGQIVRLEIAPLADRVRILHEEA